VGKETKLLKPVESGGKQLMHVNERLNYAKIEIDFGFLDFAIGD